MPDLKISQLPAATTPLAGTEIVPLVQGGTTDRATVADFLTSAVAGTAAAPSFAFSADPNTGLFSPTADTFAVTTGGTERLRVDSAGNVGIWTTSPQTNLDVSGSNAVARVTGTAGSAPQLSLSSAGAVNWSLRANSGSAAEFTIFQDSTERMRLDSGGNLGLGVTPSVNYGREIAISGSATSGVTTIGARNLATANSTAYFANNATNTGAFTDNYATSGPASKYSQNQSNHQWFTSPPGTAGTAITFTQAMTLDSGGNLGIGTTSPATRFDVRRDATDIFQARIINKDAAVGATRAAIQFENDVGVAGYVGAHGSNSGASLGGAYAGALVLQGDNANGVRVVAANGSGVFSVNTGSTSSANLRLIVNSVGNLGLGTSTFGTSAATVFSIANGTEPSTGPADTVQFYSVDRSAGNTIPGIYCEGTGVTDAAITNVTVTNKIAIKVNGTVYYLLATTSAA
jgi:hypothetical protein